MRISLIIPTVNAGASIEHLLSGISTQDEKPLETIIIDSSSTDDTVEIAKRFGAKTIVISRPSFDHGKTRNLAALETGGDVIVFMTQDALPCNNRLLSNLTAPLRSGIAAAYGRHLPRPDASPPEVFARRFNYPESPATKSIEDVKRLGVKTFFFSNVCSAVKKDTFLKVGMFPEGIRANEDMLFAAKLVVGGNRIAYVPDAVVIHSHSYSLFQLFARYYNIGSSLRNNKWVLNFARSENEGLRFLKEELAFLMREGEYFWLPYMLWEAAVKYAGYRAGLMAG